MRSYCEHMHAEACRFWPPFTAKAATTPKETQRYVFEAPSLIRRKEWVYLFFSASLWTSPNYGVYFLAAPSVRELADGSKTRIAGQFVVRLGPTSSPPLSFTRRPAAACSQPRPVCTQDSPTNPPSASPIPGAVHRALLPPPQLRPRLPRARPRRGAVLCVPPHGAERRAGEPPDGVHGAHPVQGRGGREGGRVGGAGDAACAAAGGRARVRGLRRSRRLVGRGGQQQQLPPLLLCSTQKRDTDQLG